VGLGIAIRVNDAPDEAAAAVSAVEIAESVGQPTYYRLEYGLDLAEGDFPILKEGKLGPGSEISVLVPGSEAT
jgi:hypothetical protein